MSSLVKAKTTFPMRMNKIFAVLSVKLTLFSYNATMLIGNRRIVLKEKKDKTKNKYRKIRYFGIFLRRALIALIMLLQFLFYFALVYTGTELFTWLNYVLTVLAFLLAVYVVNTDKKFSYKLSWIFLLLIAPIAGGTLYVMFHTQGVSIKYAKHARLEYASLSALYDAPVIEVPKERSALIGYLSHSGGFPLYRNGSMRYFPIGEAFFESLKEELKKAKKYIFMEYFIISEGKLWDEILEILTLKASEGVDVRIMYDDIGSLLSLPSGYPKYLAKLGIKCYCFNKFRPIITTIQNNRDHRKITVIDGITAFTGGVNIADEYANIKVRFGHWKDCGIMIKGDAARSFAVMFLSLWSIVNKKQEDYLKFYPDVKPDLVSDGFIQPYSDSPLDKEYIGEQVYINIIRSAKKYLYITTPYLIIDDNMLESLKTAAKSGIDVRIITPHIYDKKIPHIATVSYYKELIDAGVRIYEYTDGFIHSKLFVCDDEIATVGTVNLDFRSLYLHFENGVVLYGGHCIADIKADIDATLSLSTEITADKCTKNVFVRLFQSFLRLFSPLI